MSDIPFYVINLDKDVERWDLTTNRLREHGICPKRISAVYGKNLSNAELQKNTSTFVNNCGSKALIGCGLSHINTWKHVCYMKDKYAVILEDDIIVNSKCLKQDLENLISHYLPEDFDICYLGCHGKCNIDYKYNLADQYLQYYQTKCGHKVNDHVFIPEVASGAYGYMVSQKGAEKLAQLIQKVEEPIDMQMSRNFDKLNVYAVNPILIDYNYEDTSNMMATRPFLDFLSKITLDEKASLQKNLFYYQYQLFNYPLTFWMILLFLASVILSILKVPLKYIIPAYLLLNIGLRPLLLIGDLIVILLGYFLFSVFKR